MAIAMRQHPCQQMLDIRGLLHNLVSLQFNSLLYADHHHIRPILAEGEDGVWSASAQFPKTVYDFVRLTLPEMQSLQRFYNIRSAPEELSANKALVCGVDNLLFVEIARTFGLTFWFVDGFKSATKHRDSVLAEIDGELAVIEDGARQ